MTGVSIEKNVEEQLMKTKSVRRKSGDVPYPVKYSKSLSDFDIWDDMFLMMCCGSLSMHQFEEPPAVVLELGCGSGFWAVEAAKQWTTSTIIGYDLNKLQPDLAILQQHGDIARRIKWVHGNLLDGLPFPSAYFDFVRIVGVGLGVPEDEWQFVLEEVSRLMKPGAVLEIVEEDPIFPCAKPPRPRPLPITVDLPMSESMPSSAYSTSSSATLLSEPWNLSDDLDPLKTKATLSPTTSHANFSPSILTLVAPPILMSESEQPESDHMSEPDPRDHSKLKAAWEAMLSRRFLATNLLSVLPFYLSSCFVDLQSKPPLKIPLPPNSGYEQHGPRCSREPSFQEDPETLLDFKVMALDTEFVQRYEAMASTWAPMHLGKVVRTVSGCKEAIWQEYQSMFAPHFPPVVRMAKGEPIAHSNQRSSRESFEAEWAAWQNDMNDRIGMRGPIASQFAWSEPPGDRPDWKVWRATVDKVKSSAESFYSSRSSSSGHSQSPDICRSIRGFVCWKP